MKTAIVYYSMSGNTDYVAKIISKEIDANLIRISPEKEYPNVGFKKYFWGGKSAIMGDKPELQEYNFNGDDYDLIIIGTPVWASNFTPPIRTFIEENREKLKNKKFSIFTCYSGAGAIKAIEKLKKFLNIDKFESELLLIDPKDKENEDNKNRILDFCSKINNKLNRL